MIKRRDFLKMIGGIGVYVLTPFSKIAHLFPSTFAKEDSDEWEVYGGFLLMPEGAPMPAYVQCAPAPMLGQLDDAQYPDSLALRGETVRFNDFSEWISKVSFTTYILNPLPKGMEFVQGHLIRFAQSGKEFAASIDYGPVNIHEPLLSISARPIFPRPCPIWPLAAPVRAEDRTDGMQNDTVVYAEKVDFTPVPGLMFPTEQGHLLYWIKEDILYTLVVNGGQSGKFAMEIVKSLAETSPRQ